MALETLISSTLEAQGHSRIRRDDPNRLPEVYDPAFIQADCDLARIADGLLSARAGRLCLYGPPGTGKTAFGRWLAQQMGVPLAVRRASDLMSKWLGDSEKNIAQAFGEAQRDQAVLLIDEVDSFLQDRRGAQRSWEISQVNEMLTQMEAFAGVFIASTNLMDNLDPAALRRFDLKVKFDYLSTGQATELFHRYCLLLQLPAREPADLARLSRLQCLTPGDFAAVVRQSRFRQLRCATELVAALESECAFKSPAARAIGFLQ
jgi:SpoVK/Ycf46/Vps4 family AAA+-type ATPase